MSHVVMFFYFFIPELNILSLRIEDSFLEDVSSTDEINTTT